MARISIVTDDMNHCAICRSRAWLQIHHCLHGSYRAQADKDHLIVMLCKDCHTKLHDKGIHDRDLQEEGQLAWMKHYHATEDEFRAVYGKSWL